MVKTRNMQCAEGTGNTEPDTQDTGSADTSAPIGGASSPPLAPPHSLDAGGVAATESDGSIHGPIDPQSPRTDEASHSEGASNYDQKVAFRTKSKRKALAQARLELAAARLALLEAEEDGDSDTETRRATAAVGHDARLGPAPIAETRHATSTQRRRFTQEPPQATWTHAAGTAVTIDRTRGGVTPPAPQGAKQDDGDAASTAAARARDALASAPHDDSDAASTTSSDVAPTASARTRGALVSPPRDDIKHLATAILEVARGGHPAAHRCLNKRTWQHKCKATRCKAQGCDYFHHKLLHNDSGPQPCADRAAPQPRADRAAPQPRADRTARQPQQRGDSAPQAQCRTCTCTTAGGSELPLPPPPPPAYSVPRAEGGTSARPPECGACAHTDYSATRHEHATQPAAVTSTWAPRASNTFLKVLPITITGPRGKVDTFALIDDGSTVTLLTEALAAKIGAEGPTAPFYIEAVAGAHIDASSSRRVKVTVSGKYERCGMQIEARTIDRLDITAQSVSAETLIGCEHLRDITEQLVYDAGEPAVLIGQDNWELLLASEVRRGERGQPVASRTPLGWVLHGQSGSHTRTFYPRTRTGHRCNHVRSDTSLEQLVQDHFKLESLGVEPRRPQTDPETRALHILQNTTRALPEGGYETGLLWKEEGKNFPNNYAATLKRLEGVERRLQRDPLLKQKYKEQLESMTSSGYAEVAPTAPPAGKTWYLPHFPVINPSKPGKVRIVHDAAARTYGVCLNDYLLTGPDLLQSLLGVLMRFRQKRVAVAADIKDMFLRIQVRQDDRDALRFLWREKDGATPTEYRMKSVLFGASSSPSTAIYIKNHNAYVHSVEFPEAVEPIINNHYMDDFLQSFDDAEEANRVCRAVDAVHRRGNFELQKWASNDSAAIADLVQGPAATDKAIEKQEKVLGLVWHTADDTLTFNFSKFKDFSTDRPTKRLLLKVAMTLYDPLGLLAPVTVQAKRIVQETWHRRLGWDDRLPKEVADMWNSWLVALRNAAGIALPRCYPNYSHAQHLGLHVFVDASEGSYAAAAYWRTVDNIGNVNVSLAAAKGRVAPLKVISIPRLELQAAVLGGRLAHTVEQHHERRPDRRVLWTDSRTVLAWLRAPARSFKPFVAHRVAELEDTTAGAEWRWVPTAYNTADDATRDVPSDFTASHRWFRGPDFLYGDEKSWPLDPNPLTSTETGEERVTMTMDCPRLKEALPEVTRFSDWHRLIRSTARVLQFIDRCRPRASAALARTRRAATSDPDWKRVPPRTTPGRRATPTRPARADTQTTYIPVPAQYTRRSELLWTRSLQQDCFTAELRCVTGGRNLPADSRLRQLSLTVDDQGVLRLRSRIAAATGIAEDTSSPAILDGDHAYCRLYIDKMHRQLHHSGVECITNEVRQHYWVLRLRPTVRTVIKRCQLCRLRRATPTEPRTGDLPPCRLAHHQRPFTYTGLDYFGPLSVTVNRHHEKRYVALFTCLTTRAVHLEVASSLSTDAAVLALRRMMARRGCPDTIWSDNGTNFHGADAELRRAAMTSIQREADIRHINWRYIPPGAPFMGGAWERMVRSVKTALRTVLQERHPHEDVLHTLLTEVEHTVNSRPLSHVSVAPEDDTALTPNHFLLGGPSKVPLPGTFTKVDELGRSHWRASQRLADLFWQRWVREVLPLLQNRREPHGRGEAIKVGDMVIIVDSTLPRNVWPKGRVERVHPGTDGVIRVVDVRTKSGVMRRPTKRLVVIPTDHIEGK